MRYKYMDSLRAVLMIGGVFYHAALVYRVGASWIVKDPSEIYIFNYFTEFISSFRMSTFFFVAGFFCCMTFMKRDVNENLRLRLLAFLMPFFSVAVTLLPIQYYLKLKHNEVSLSLIQFIYTFFERGEYVSHLWFLINLVVYYVFIWIFLKYLKSLCGKHINKIKKTLIVSDYKVLNSKAVISIVLAMYFFPLAYFLSKISIINGISLPSLVKYFPFFILGYFSFKDSYFFEKLLKINTLDIIFLVIIFYLKINITETGIHRKIIGLIFFYHCALLVGMFVVSTFKKFFNDGGTLVSIISDSAYTIYLFHQIIIVSISMLLLKYEITDNHLLKYSTVVFITIILTCSIHKFLILRFYFLRLLFNGKKSSNQMFALTFKESRLFVINKFLWRSRYKGF